ncbi:MAG: CDP-diacylglycerol--glycerol-3-phosphate 3-phosphatidyltransferase, partial [Olegusella sp.]|nr:CDP-diacylglycerol--glycerol-3-phosphate 3-phosphatidyltransferase [Olegusella sp.]
MSTGKNGSIWTPANVVTCIRIACVPVWLLVAELVPAATTSFSGAALGVALFYMLISLTDKL